MTSLQTKNVDDDGSGIEIPAEILTHLPKTAILMRLFKEGGGWNKYYELYPFHLHSTDDAYSIRSTWSCYWLDQFLTLALNTLILSIFYISLDLSTIYFAHFSGC